MCLRSCTCSQVRHLSIWICAAMTTSHLHLTSWRVEVCRLERKIMKIYPAYIKTLSFLVHILCVFVIVNLLVIFLQVLVCVNFGDVYFWCESEFHIFPWTYFVFIKLICGIFMHDFFQGLLSRFSFCFSFFVANLVGLLVLKSMCTWLWRHSFVHKVLSMATFMTSRICF